MFRKFLNLFKRKKKQPTVYDRFLNTAFTREQLICALKTLRVHSNHCGVPHPRQGICGNVAYYLRTEHDVPPFVGVSPTHVLCDLFLDWPEHSGQLAWPIKEDHGHKKWSGQNLETRTRLIDYTIDRLERQV